MVDLETSQTLVNLLVNPILSKVPQGEVHAIIDNLDHLMMPRLIESVVKLSIFGLKVLDNVLLIRVSGFD